MYKIQSYFYTILLLTLLLAVMSLHAVSALAEDGVEPSQNLQGLWAAPDCRNWEELQYYTKHFIITYDQNTKHFQITPTRTLLTQREYSVITIDGVKTPVRVLEDGVLQQIDIKKDADFSKEWDDLSAIRYHEYMHCFDTRLPEHLAELMELSVRLDNIYENCQYSISEKCKETVFAAYMQEQNNTLTIKDIKHILQDIADISQAVSNRSLSTRDIDYIANLILSILDRNGSKDINLQELQKTETLWTHPKLTGPAKHKLQTMMKVLLAHFPSLQPPKNIE